MKTLVAAALLALGVLSAVSAVPAQAQYYDGYPEWAQRALEPHG